MDEIELLDRVLTKTGRVIAGVDDRQLSWPTPCDQYDVADLLDHLVGWIQVFLAGSEGRVFEGDVTALHRGDDPAGQFLGVVERLVASWRAGGIDRDVRVLSGAQLPSRDVFSMTLTEYTTHGWDLAKATGQAVPYTEEEAAAVLERAYATPVPPQYRGPGQAFGEVIPLDDRAPAIDRLVAFTGRPPRWRSVRTAATT